jgi:DNA-binding LytR/AlgR family response regulator
MLNYKHLLGGKAVALNQAPEINSHDSDTEVNIASRLKRESLSFLSKELLYVSSAGNYVEFNLYRDSKLEKVMIRNSISEIEKQFAHIPYYFRSHRAFIVNLNRVLSKKGNALGYSLSISDSNSEVPVSRQYVKAFDVLFH